MKALILTLAILILPGLKVGAQPMAFQPKHLAVLRAGDGVLDFHLRQSPAFIDQFAPGKFNPEPSFTVSIPTNGPDTLFFNGHAATEGLLARSLDHRLLTVAGYGGVNLLQSNGTPSLLQISRAFCTVDCVGKVRTMIYRKTGGEEKMNPRGVVTDGTNHFWGCGNSFGTVYYQPGVSAEPVSFANIPNSRAVKFVGYSLYVTLNGPDALAGGLYAGLFSFTDRAGDSVALPQSPESNLQLEVEVRPPYTKIAGFDMNAAGTIAYFADTVAGIQKYVNSGGTWKFAYNFSIPQHIPAKENCGTGCFALAVDFNATAPIIYATTTEGYNGSVNSNRVVQIVDTNGTATVTTLAQARSPRIAYRGIDLTPEP